MIITTWYNNHLTLNVLGWGLGLSLFIHMDPKLSTYLKDNNCSVISVKQARAFSSWNIWTPFYDMLRGFCHSSVGKESASNAGDLGSIPGWGRSPGEGNGNPLQYSCLENPMDRGAWRATVHGVENSWTWLNEWHTQPILTECLKGALFSKQKRNANRWDPGVSWKNTEEGKSKNMGK